MKRFMGWTKLSVIGFVTLQFCVAVFAQVQQEQQDLGREIQTSQTSQTGTGMGNTGMTAAKSGQADGMGNLQQLGGERRPLYRLNRSDVVALSFTLSPEFDQTPTIQPDGYIFLKDASAVLAQGLTLEELQLAVRRQAPSRSGHRPRHSGPLP